MSITRLVLVSDLHGYLPTDLPQGDLLLIAGDICPVDQSHEPAMQSGWLEGTFRVWLERMQRAYAGVIGIAGNHDFVYERGLQPLNLPWSYLQDSGITMNGIRIWGSPWTPPFMDWAFNLREDGIHAALDAVDDDSIDVLITHGPPRGHLDMTRRGEAVGSLAVAAAVHRINPLVHLFGHIHEGYGIERSQEILLVNASLRDEIYRPVNAPVVVDIDVEARSVEVIPR